MVRLAGTLKKGNGFLKLNFELGPNWTVGYLRASIGYRFATPNSPSVDAISSAEGFGFTAVSIFSTVPVSLI